MNTFKKSYKSNYFWAVGISILIIFLVLRESWFCDDAFFTFRSAMNLHYGFGPVWNTGERIQNYTNILWMFLVSLASAQNIYIWTLTLSISFLVSTLIFIVYLGKLSANYIFLTLSLLLLCFSWVYIDFGTSGLETPLSGFFVASTFLLTRHLKKSVPLGIYFRGFWVGLSYLSRPDLIIITFLDSIFDLIENNKSKTFINFLKFTFSALTIFFIWSFFSLIYYGFPFPITAYTKLSTGIDRPEIIIKGISYLINFCFADISGAFLLFIAFVLPLFSDSMSNLKEFLVTNYFVNLLIKFRSSIVIFIVTSYVIWIGGDFMIGRFFYPVMVYSACSLASSNPKKLNIKIIYPVIISITVCIFSLFANARMPYILGLSCCAPKYHLTSFSHIKYGDIGRGWGVLSASHEKRFYAPYTYFFDSGFLRHSAMRIKEIYEKENIKKGENDEFVGGGYKLENASLEKQSKGFASSAFHAGPNINFYENIGLTDHIQSRIPVIKDTVWQPAHFNKVYIKRNKPELIRSDDDLRKLHKSFSLITKDSLFSRRRLVEIYRQNTGYYNKNYINVLNKYSLKNKSNCEIAMENLCK